LRCYGNITRTGNVSEYVLVLGVLVARVKCRCVSAVFVRSLSVGDDAVDLARVVACLLHCLPLLHTGNAPAKAAYLHVLPSVLRRCTETGCYLPDCQQVLSYALIHPAISGDELTPLSAWQPQLQPHNDVPGRSFMTDQLGSEHVLINGPAPPSATSAPPDPVSNGGGGGGGHREPLSAARSLPVGLLHEFNSSSSLAARPSRTSVHLQHSSPPPGLQPRALTPPRPSEFTRLSLSLSLSVSVSLSEHVDSLTQTTTSPSNKVR